MSAHLRTVSVVAISLATGCMTLSPQLQPTDHGKLEKIESREDRERAYAENSIYVHRDARGVRYAKGDDPNAPTRGWQSLDAILRSDAHAAAALPRRKQRAARILTALTVVSGVATTAGFVASAREGLDLKAVTGTGALLIAGGVLTLGCGVAAGVLYGRMRKDYEHAVEIYNDSLGMRLGLYTPGGEYRPPEGVQVDEEGFVILETPEDRLYGPRERAAPAPAEPAPAEPAPEPGPAEPAPELAPSDAAGSEDATEPAKPRPLILMPPR